MVLLILVVAGCGSSKSYTLVDTRACLESRGVKIGGPLDFVASTATGGAFVATLGDTLSRFGMTEWFQLGKFLGVLFLFAGFLVSIEVFREIRIPFTSIQLSRIRRESPEAIRLAAAAGAPSEDDGPSQAGDLPTEGAGAH